MIKLQSISKSFGDQTLFEDLSFAVNRRERVGLVGRNGHGKTTLFRIIRGEISPDSGDVAIPRRYRLGFLDQTIELTQDTVLGEACLGLPEGRRDETWKAEKILFGLGFTQDDLSRAPSLFSGGYQVRLNLAKVLVSEPDMLLLDEPTNYLDVVSIRWLARFLRTWPSELMLITHDRSFMDSVVTHTVGIHRKKVKKIEGDTGKLYDQILQEEEIHEKTRLNDEKKRKEIERFIERFRAKNSLATRVQSRIKFLAKHERLDKLDRIQELEFSFRAAAFPAKVMMRVEDLSFGYKPEQELISGLGFEILKHDRICVIGQNGKGKSTLLRLLAGELSPRHGAINNHPRLATGYFAQTNLSVLQPSNTVVEEIQSTDGGCLPQTARNVAGAMMFEGDAGEKRISVLSGGEKSRVMLGKLIVSPCNLLLLDEPTNHLDMDSCDSLLAAIDAFDGAVVVVTHNEMFLRTLATRFVVFDRGRVWVYDRTYDEFLETYGWENDEMTGGRTTKQRNVDKKALRQARAKVMQEKSRALAPLTKRSTALEDRIVEQETEEAKTLDAMTEASAAGDGTRIAELSQRHTELRASIEKAYGDLEKVTREVEALERRFEKQLREAEQD